MSLSQNEINENIKCVAEYKSVGSSKSELIQSIQSISPQNGKFQCKFPTKTKFTDMTINVTHGDSQSAPIILLTQKISFMKNCVEDTLQITPQNMGKTLKSGSVVDLIAHSTKPIDNLIMYIVVRGSIINATYVSYDTPNIDQILQVKLTKAMVPEVLVAVFMKSPNTDIIIADSLLLNVKGAFTNEVGFDVKTPVVDAGQDSKFSVSSLSESYVFLLGVDVSLLAVKQGNDISYERVLEQLLNDEYYKTKTDGFLQTGMNFLSDYRNECSQATFFDLKIDLKDPDDLNNKDDQAHKIRKNFQEVWIWDQFNM